MLALKSGDAEADQREFEDAGVSAGPPFRFTRMARLPDGTDHEIAVVLAYAATEATPDATFFACEPIRAERLWNPAYTEHPNGARGVVGVAAVARRPREFRHLLAAATGASPTESSGALEVQLGDGRLSLLAPAGFQNRYGLEAPDPRDGLILAAFEVAVEEVDRVAGSNPGASQHGDAWVVPPAPGLGAVLAFREGGDG